MMSGFNIETNTDVSQVGQVITCMLDVIGNLQIIDKQIKTAKMNICLEILNNKELPTANYITSLLHRIPIVDKAAFLKKVQHISRKAVRKGLTEFQKDVLKRGLIFYYSAMDIRKHIRKTPYTLEYLVL
jgi:hypothetical protein